MGDDALMRPLFADSLFSAEMMRPRKDHGSKTKQNAGRRFGDGDGGEIAIMVENGPNGVVFDIQAVITERVGGVPGTGNEVRQTTGVSFDGEFPLAAVKPAQTEILLGTKERNSKRLIVRQLQNKGITFRSSQCDNVTPQRRARRC